MEWQCVRFTNDDSASNPLAFTCSVWCFDSPVLIVLFTFVGVQTRNRVLRLTLYLSKLVAKVAIVGHIINLIGHLIREYHTLMSTCWNVPLEVCRCHKVGCCDLTHHWNILSNIYCYSCFLTKVSIIVSYNVVRIHTLSSWIINNFQCTTRCWVINLLNKTLVTTDNNLRNAGQISLVDSLCRCIELQCSLQSSGRISRSGEVLNHLRCSFVSCSLNL